MTDFSAGVEPGHSSRSLQTVAPLSMFSDPNKAPNPPPFSPENDVGLTLPFSHRPQSDKFFVSLEIVLCFNALL